MIGAAQQSVFSQNTAQIGTTVQPGHRRLLVLAASVGPCLRGASRRDAREYGEPGRNRRDQRLLCSRCRKQAIVEVDASDLQYQNVLVDAAKAKEHAGIAPGVDVLRAQVNQTKSASTLVGAHADVDNSREDLAQTIGASLDQTFVFPKGDRRSRNCPPRPSTPSKKLRSMRGPTSSPRASGVSAAQLTRKGWDRELFPQVQLSAAIR